MSYKENQAIQDESSTVTLPSAGRLMALDIGAKRTGIAVSDELRLTVRALPALLESPHAGNFLQDVADLVKTYHAQALIIGLPLRMNGSSGDAAVRMEGIARKLAKKLSVPIYLQDERLTSLEAEETLRSRGKKTDKQRKNFVDSEAAAIILRDYLAS